MSPINARRQGCTTGALRPSRLSSEGFWASSKEASWAQGWDPGAGPIRRGRSDHPSAGTICRLRVCQRRTTYPPNISVQSAVPVLDEEGVTTIAEYKPFGPGTGINLQSIRKENKSIVEDGFSYV